MLDTVDSGKARPGQFFRFETLHAVEAPDKRVVIPPHTVGWGIVSVAVPAGRAGRSGSLLLEPLYLKLPDGTKLGVVLDHGDKSLGGAGRSGDLPGYLGAIPVIGLGVSVVIGAFNFFHHGTNVTIRKGTRFAIFPDDDPSTAFCQP